MELGNMDSEQSKHNYIEDCMHSKCGEIIINDNQSEIEFNLVCLHCGILSQAFDDFRNHFLNEHYNLDKNIQTLTRCEDSSKSYLLENYEDYSNDFNISQESTETVSSKYKELHETEKESRKFSDSDGSTILESEIKFERCGNFDEKSTISLNEERLNSGEEAIFSGNISTIYGGPDNVFPKQNVLKIGRYIGKEAKYNSKFPFHEKNVEKTIEIYKEHYIPQKPTFILAAVNLPIKTNISNDCKDSSSKNEADTQAFRHDGGMNIEAVSEECKPKFKFNDIKFRRHHNEKYYLSIEKTFNENDGFFHCPECLKHYRRIESLRYHYLSHTGAPAPYQCSICSKGFPSAYKVRIHFTKHTGERPFRCHLCPRVYRHKQQLKFHLETHTNLNFNSDEININTDEISSN